MEIEEVTKREHPASSLWAGGLLAISLVLLQCFLPLSKTDLDLASLICISSLSLAIPILAYKIVINTLRARKISTRSSRYGNTPGFELISFIIGFVAVLVGIAAAFYHIHWIAALIFSSCTVITIIAYTIHSLA